MMEDGFAAAAASNSNLEDGSGHTGGGGPRPGGGGGGGGGRRLSDAFLAESGEEEALEEATEALAAAEARAAAASERLAAAIAVMGSPYVAYPAYWVDGLGTSLEAIEGAAAAGVSARAIVWGRPAPPPPDEFVSPPEPPELYRAVQEASGLAGWTSKLGLTATLEVDIPPTPEGERV